MAAGVSEGYCEGKNINKCTEDQFALWKGTQLDPEWFEFSHLPLDYAIEEGVRDTRDFNDWLWGTDVDLFLERPRFR